MKLPLAYSSDTLRSKEAGSSRLVNWYAEKGGKDGIYIKPIPGFAVFAALVPDVGSGVRSLYTASNGIMYAIAGNTLFELTSNGTSINRGNINTSSGQISMADNGLQLMISEESAGWTYTFLTNALAAVPTFPGGGPVIYQGSYFLTIAVDSQKFYVSNLLNGNTWDSLDFSSADSSPDNLISIIRNGNDVWLMGEASTEVWYNTGNADFPYEKIQGAESEIGCVSKYGVAQINDHIIWVGANGEGKGQIWMSNGYTPQRISTYAVEFSLSEMPLLSDAVAYTYQEGGHVFYVVNFNQGKKTWSFDITEGRWHERMQWDSNLKIEKRQRANTHAFFNEKNYVGDYQTSTIYLLSETEYLDNTLPIIRICEIPNIHAERNRMFFKQIELDIERGVGLTNGQGSDPQIMMQWSDDGGHTWNNEYWRSAGKVGEYTKRVIWRQLGESRSRSFRFKTSDPVNFTLIGLTADVEIGNG